MKHLILGNGPAGVVAAETLRRLDPQAEITMVGCEDVPPYSRMAIPYRLIGQIGEEGMYLRKDPQHFKTLGIHELRGKAAKLDEKAKTVTLADGSVLAYDRLLIATGSHPIKPPVPGIDLPDVHTCWTMDDLRAIMGKADAGKRVLQVGAGFIGCIILEALAERGVALTVIEMGDRMVPRMMTPSAGGMIKSWVESKGVRVITDARVERIEADAAKPSLLGAIAGMLGAKSDNGGPMKVSLSTGEVMEFDLVIASAGVRPNIDFLSGTAVEVGNGILVDETLQTNVADVYAAGDVAEAIDFSTGKRLVNAIQPNAVDQARIAACNMAGQRARSQGTLAINVLETMGLVSSSFGQWWGVEGGDKVEHVDRNLYRYLSLQFDGDVLIGATSVGLTQHVGALRGLIQNRTPLGHWKKTLLESPTRFVEAYVACSQQPTALSR
jgi:NADPH-dependent 2,4-dienoyl-CoA reductase/sulfur reductase-like enzyme